MVANPFNPQNLNRFSYANNSPVNFTDPSGHFICSSDINSDDYCPNHGSTIGTTTGSYSGGGSGGDQEPDDAFQDWIPNATSNIVEINIVAGIPVGFLSRSTKVIGVLSLEGAAGGLWELFPQTLKILAKEYNYLPN